DREQPLDFAPVDETDDFVGVGAGLRQFVRVHAPHARHVGAVLGVGEVAPAGKLVALLPVLASALPVGLARDGAVAAVLPPDAPGGEHDVDGAHHVLYAV